jgi:sialic acid synthase SpsE
MRTLVIAEPGSCHDGDLGKLLRLAEEAKRAGVDVFKMQYWGDPNRLADRRRVPDAYRELYRRFRPHPNWLGQVKRECQSLGLALGVTVYLPEDAYDVAGVADYFKVASFEAESADLLHEMTRYVGPRLLFISLGMGAARRIQDGGCGYPFVRYLKCVSAYPAPADQLRLSEFWPRIWCREGFDGLSDHSDPALTWTGALAVAAGAGIVEAHLKLDDTDAANPDTPHAMTPRQFADYVRHIRFAEACVGDAHPGGVLPCETPMAAFKVKT